jgi:hypothetical protein
MSNFSMPGQILTGSQRRSQRRAVNPAAFTRAAACAFIAGTDDPESIARFAKHGNGRVRKYVEHKLGLLSREPNVFERFVGVRVWTADTAAEVLSLMAEHGLDVSACAEACGVKPRKIKDWQRKLAS